MKLYHTLYNLIYSYLNFIEKLNFIIICKKFNKFVITDMCYIDEKYRDKLNENILKQRTYAQVTKLDLSTCFISNLNYLSSLKKLYINSSEIGDDCIKDLNLECLSVNENIKIKNLKHMTKLKFLNISNKSGVDDEEINELINLKILIVSNNDKISKIKHLIQLKHLDVSFNSAINDNSLI